MRVNLANLFGRLVSLAPRKPLTLSRLALRGSRYDAASNVPAIRGDPEARVANPRSESTSSDPSVSSPRPRSFQRPESRSGSRWSRTERWRPGLSSLRCRSCSARCCLFAFPRVDRPSTRKPASAAAGTSSRSTRFAPCATIVSGRRGRVEPAERPAYYPGGPNPAQAAPG